MIKNKVTLLNILLLFYMLVFSIEDISSVLRISPNVFKVLLLGISILIFAGGFLINKCEIYISGVYILASVFFIICLLSYYFMGIDKAYGLDKITSVLFLLIGYFLISSLRLTNDNINYVLNVIIIIYSTLLILFFVSNLNELISSILIGGRISSDRINPIWLARMIGGTALLIILKTKKNLLKLLVGAGSLLLIIATGSKGPLVAGVIILAYDFIINSYSKYNINILFKKICMLIIILMGIYVFFKYVVFNIISIDFIIERLTSENIGYLSRENRIRLSIEYFNNNPIFGIGFGNWGFYFMGIFGRDYPHNVFLEVLSELGLVGITVFTMFMITPIIKTRKYIKNNNLIRILIYMYIFYIINSLLSGDLSIANKEIFLFNALIVCMYGKLSGIRICKSRVIKKR